MTALRQALEKELQLHAFPEFSKPASELEIVATSLQMGNRVLEMSYLPKVVRIVSNGCGIPTSKPFSLPQQPRPPTTCRHRCQDGAGPPHPLGHLMQPSLGPHHHPIHARTHTHAHTAPPLLSTALFPNWRHN